MSSILLLIGQIGVVIAAARALGFLFRRIHQPQVVGEMVAGILLGPTLLGALAPALSATLFPPESLGQLATLSQVGLMIFMFLVGLEFDPQLLHGRGRTAVVTSISSIVVPFLLGVLLAFVLYPRIADATVAFAGFALFMGAAMSVTAFPVLARILTERNLMQTRVGALAVAGAAVGDVAAWGILAAAIAMVRSGKLDAPLATTVLGTLAYVVVMLFVVRRGLRWLVPHHRNRGRLTQDVLALVLLLVFASAWCTERLGIHALFGAFCFGAVMPRDRDLINDLTGKLEDITVVFLLPLFFATTGLRTNAGAIAGGDMWVPFLLVLIVAVVGKFGGATLAARATGFSWREASAVGILLNTRGLMELVILSIALELGVISPALFTIMVLMAVVTTFMTTPVLDWLYPHHLRAELGAEGEGPAGFTILIPLALPSAGPGLVRAAAAVVPDARTPRILAVHLQLAADQSLTQVRAPRPAVDEEALRPALGAAADLGVVVSALAFVSRDAARDIADLARVRRADLILMGWHKPILAGGILGGTVGAVLDTAKTDVAVLIDRGSRPWRRILVPFQNDAEDGGALGIGRRIARRTGGAITLHEQPTDDEAPPECDLIVVGVMRSATLGGDHFRPRYERLVRETDASALIVRTARSS